MNICRFYKSRTIGSNHTSTVKVKLRKGRSYLERYRFSANIKNIRDTFEDLFFAKSRQIISELQQNSLNIQKFQYLKGSLRNESFQIIQSLETTDENYTTAWNLLKISYENKQLIINTHLKNILELADISKKTHGNEFIDIVRTNVSALKTLKESIDRWNTILIYILNAKLDWRSHQM